MCLPSLFNQTIEFDPRRFRTLGEPLREFIKSSTKTIEQFCATQKVFLECVQRFLIPTHQNLMRTAGNVWDVDLNFSLLADTVKPPDALLE